MHHLFGLVLAQKDLSRAGDLFSLEDAEIEGSLSEALEQIRIISSSAVSETLFLIIFHENKCINKILRGHAQFKFLEKPKECQAKCNI